MMTIRAARMAAIIPSEASLGLWPMSESFAAWFVCSFNK
jgi:hypothetical protein